MTNQIHAQPGERTGGTDQRAVLPVTARSRQITRAAIALAIIGVAAWLASAFIPALAWAILIAMTTWPAYVRLAALIPEPARRLLAPPLFTLVVGTALLIPLMLALQQVAQAGDGIARWLGRLQDSGISVPQWIERLPLAGGLLVTWWQDNLSEPQAAARWLRGIDLDGVTAWTRALGGEFLNRLVLFLLTLVTLLFLYRDGGWLAERALATADRFLGDPGERLVSKIAEAVRGTVNGTVAVAVLQGLVLGMAYVAIGAPDAALLMLLTMAFALLPLGAEIAVALVSLLLLVQGFEPWTVLALFAFGLAVTIIGDNVVWPALVGRSARLPFLFALIGVLGGVQAFGLVGLFVGPVIMAMLLTVWREWISPGADQPQP
jgi:predicted PurR-regulated permease PerM